MYSPAFPRASKIDWSDYVGFTLFSADNKCLGKIERIVHDSGSGATLLRVNGAGQDGAVFYIHATAVGVIARDRLMLDSYQDKVPEILWEPPVADEVPVEG